MDTTFRHNLTFVTVAHFGIVFAILVTALIRGCVSPRRSPEILTYVSLQPIQAPREIAAEPEADPEAEPVEPVREPEPEPVPEVAKPKPAPKKIEISKRRIRQTDPNPPPPQRLTREEIDKKLALDSAATPTQTALPAWYYALVRSALYDAWDEPSAASVRPGVTAQVAFRVERNGTVSERRLSRPSGDGAMDASVMQALQSISRIKELPSDFNKDHEVITVDFELAGTQ